MQTFLPYPDFELTARTLDYLRLGKQRVEAKQILNALRRGRGGWFFHPAVQMWRGYENALRLYMNTMIREWKRRGYRNTMRCSPIRGPVVMPPWMGWPDFHASHRSNLFRKNPIYYGRFNWKTCPELPYIWPKSRRTV